MSYECLLLEKQDGVAVITLNRPEVLNALSYKLLGELKSALEEVHRDDGIRAVILTGAGRAFCAGRDLKEVAVPGTQTVVAIGSELARIIEAMSKPVIAAVNGHCYTGGLELALLCDMIFASDKAIFADTHARYGLVHGWGGTQRLPRLVGRMRGLEMLLSSEAVDAREAERIGLVNRVVPADKLMETVRGLAARIAANHPDSVRIIRGLVRRGLKGDLALGLDLEAAAHREYRERGLGRESQERLKGFVERKR